MQFLKKFHLQIAGFTIFEMPVFFLLKKKKIIKAVLKAWFPFPVYDIYHQI